jgi:hypothetical protein
MKQPVKQKMKEKKEAMKAKKEAIKAKLKGVAAPIAAGTALVALMLLTACQTADPASRSNNATYGDLEPRITVNGSSNYVHLAVTVGDGVIASADGGGDTQSNTPTQTTDTKPEVAVCVGGGSAGTGGGSPTAGLTDKLMTALKGLGLVTGTNEGAVKEVIDAACKDGNCAPK